MNNLAVIFHHEGRLEESRELHKEVLETENRVLGADHPHTLTSKHNLESLYNNAACWKEAAVLEAQVFETRSKGVLGAEHLEIALSINSPG